MVLPGPLVSRETRVRRRNSLLQLVEHFRTLDPEIVVNDILVFLYVCENEGLNITELARLARLTEATASRRARALASPDIPFPVAPSMGLVDIFQGEDGRQRLLYLTDKGRETREIVDRLIGAAIPVARPRGAPASAPAHIAAE